MDLEEWEILPGDELLEIHDDGGKQNFSTKYGRDPKNVFNMNYFICASPNSMKTPDPPEMGNQFLPVPIQLEKVKVITDVPIKTEKISGVKAAEIGAVWETDHHHTVSQVFFNKTKENEFVDMKMDFPKSSGWGTVPQIDAGLFELEDRKGEVKIEGETDAWKNRVESEDSKENVNWERENGGVNILKWSLSGIGAICSFGVVAATICIIIFGNGNHKRNKEHNHKIRFQIYSDEKRIKQVVHHATKLNEATSAVRDVPLATAHFTYANPVSQRQQSERSC